MTDREKVIHALELCRYDPDPGQEKKWDHSCLKCPYCTDHTGMGMDCARMYTDAIALLQEQEPRVLTLEEVRDEAEYMFLEKRSATWSDLFGCAIRGDWDGYGMDLLLGEDDYIRGMWENYGKTWRCWTARPTNEQREAVKWDA